MKIPETLKMKFLSAWESDNKVFYEIKVVSLVLSLVLKTFFGMFLACFG
jgi:hypothetical protein